jgi:hypothetical protein
MFTSQWSLGGSFNISPTLALQSKAQPHSSQLKARTNLLYRHNNAHTASLTQDTIPPPLPTSQSAPQIHSGHRSLQLTPTATLSLPKHPAAYRSLYLYRNEAMDQGRAQTSWLLHPDRLLWHLSPPCHQLRCAARMERAQLSNSSRMVLGLAQGLEKHAIRGIAR